mgnify:FL=1
MYLFGKGWKKCIYPGNVGAFCEIENMIGVFSSFSQILIFNLNVAMDSVMTINT